MVYTKITSEKFAKFADDLAKAPPLDRKTMWALVQSKTREEYCRVLNRWLRRVKVNCPGMEAGVGDDGRICLVPVKVRKKR